MAISWGPDFDRMRWEMKRELEMERDRMRRDYEHMMRQKMEFGVIQAIPVAVDAPKVTTNQTLLLLEV